MSSESSSVDVRAQGAAPAPKKPLPPEQIYLHAYPKLVYWYPVLVAGYLLGLLHLVGAPPAVLGTLWLIAFTVSIATAGVDISRNTGIIVILTVVSLGLIIALLRAYGFSLGWIGATLDYLKPGYDPKLGLCCSIILTILFIFMIVYVRFDERWMLSSNQIEHTSWGRSELSLTKGTKTIRMRYPDVLELLLLGAGDVVVFDANGHAELARIENVPLLWFKAKQLEEFWQEVLTRNVDEAEDNGEES